MEIEIAAISVDVQNFRHAEVGQERDAIRLLLADDRTHKISELAQDIVDLGGLDPSSLLIVAEDAVNKGQYIALEGNRRVTALKTMMTPDLAAGLPVYALFKRLHSSFVNLGLRTVDCLVLDRATAAVWIKRKHYKGMGGRGVLPWNAVATARSDAKEGRFTRWMTALAYLEENGVDAEDLRDQISKKTTTVERVLTSSHVTPVLGLLFARDGKLAPENGDTAGAAALLHDLLTAMADKGFTEPLVSTAEQQRIFLERFEKLNVKKQSKLENGAENSSEGNEGGEGIGGSSPNGAATGGQSTGNGQASNVTKTKSRSQPVRERVNLAEKGLQISNQNLNKFYIELKKLRVKSNLFISSALLRVFLEKATTVFLEEMKIPPLNQSSGATWHDYGIKLKTKVSAALKQIDPSQRDPKLKPAWDVANGHQDKLHSLNELNRAIHDHHAIPSAHEIIVTWDRFHPYFKLMFETIENSR